MAFSSALRSSPLAAAAAHAASPRQRLSVGSRCLARVVSGSSRSSRAAARALSVRCEQSSKGGSAVDVWAGRLAMMSFATAVVSEVSTGKGLVENFGVATPAPALALVVTALVGGLAVLFIVRSGEQQD